jgi:hypothetical protein
MKFPTTRPGSLALLLSADEPPRVAIARRRFLRTLGACAAAAILLPKEVFASAADTVKAFLGSFNHAGGDKERAARDKAIEDVVDDMSIFARGIARDKLKEANPIASTLKFAESGGSLTVTLGKRTYTAPLDGRSVKVKAINGDDMDMKYKVGENRIEQIFSGDEKGRINTFKLDGDTVTMHVRIHAEALPKDLVYKLTYARG